MKGVSTGAARRYARALLDTAREKKEDAAALRQALDGAVGALGAHPDLRDVLAHPAVSIDKKKKIVEALFADEPALLRRLVALLVERDRLPLLPRIAELYAALHNEQRGVVAAHVASAVALGEAERTALADAIRKATGHEVELTTRVDPEVLGGVRVTMGGRVYDGTVRAQLAAMRQRLVAGAARP